MAVIKRLICIILLLALLGLPFFGGKSGGFCSDKDTEAEKYASQLGRLRLIYRESALIAEAICLGAADTADKEQNAGTEAFCRYEITFVYAGKAREGDSITVRGSGMTGSEKLLYLKPAETDCPEGLPCYEICENGEFHINGGMITLNDGTLLPANVLEADIRAQEKIMRAPSQYMYYRDLDSLILGCGEIFIARVECVSEFVPAECRFSVKGESVEKSCSIAEAELMILNGLAGFRAYGEKLAVTLVDEMRDYVIDNESLTVIPNRNAAALKAGEIYVFFINHGEDAKEEAYFLVNPYQGYLRINGDALYACAPNPALKGIALLPAFTKELYSVLGGELKT